MPFYLDEGPPTLMIPSEFTNIWETAYDVTDTTFDCEVNRTKGDTSTQMYLINHFLVCVFCPNVMKC